MGIEEYREGIERRKAEIGDRQRMVEEKSKQVSLKNLHPSWDLIGMDASAYLQVPWATRRLKEVEGTHIKPHLYWS